jgi:hypothetical protein
MARKMPFATAVTGYEQGRISQDIAAMMMGMRLTFLNGARSTAWRKAWASA